MTSVIIFACALLFAHWIIQRYEEPEIIFNALYALGAVLGFILVCLGVFELCGCAM